MTVAQKTVSIGNVTCGNDQPLMLIAGPCAIESQDHALDMAGALKEITTRLGIGYVYKSSFDKANRTSLGSARGTGLDAGLKVLEAVKTSLDLPLLTDIHLPDQCAEVASVVDVLQIPAFLCRQTDLLVAAAATGQAVNVKKGQFLAPWDMAHVAEKLTASGNENILLTERGTSFGYNTLVSDMRSLPQLAATGYPVIFDATHSVSSPVVWAGHLVASVSLCRCWHGQRLLSVLQVSLLKPIRTRQMHPLTGRIWCPSMKWKTCLQD